MNKRVILCITCKGVGSIEVIMRLRHTETETVVQTCRDCKGEGRMIEVYVVQVMSLERYEKDYESIGDHMCRPRTAGATNMRPLQNGKNSFFSVFEFQKSRSQLLLRKRI